MPTWFDESRLDDERALAGADQVLRRLAESGARVRREVTEAVSAVAANTQVREELRARQRQWADERGGGVIEGRDIGSVVFPDATLKLFITATPRTRAERRVAEIGGDIDDVATSIAERDRRDMSRADGPLRTAEGAVMVDTTGLTIDDVVTRIVELLDVS